jgi:uncharacterized OB-fold protein
MAERRPDRTLGGANDSFWDWCAQGELRIQHCASCGEYSWPPVESCEHCHGDALEWQRMSGRGAVAAWCSFEQDYYGGILQVPYDTILVELEEGPLFISNPDGFDWRDIAPGMPVQLTFRDSEDSAGSFSLPVFAKA